MERYMWQPEQRDSKKWSKFIHPHNDNGAVIYKRVAKFLWYYVDF